MFMMRRVQFSLQPCHPLFIGPRIPRYARDRLKELARRPHVTATNCPGHPLFIGPMMSRKLKKKLAYHRYHEKNRDTIIAGQKKYGRENRKALTEYANERRRKDPKFAMRSVLRNRLCSALRDVKTAKAGRTMDLVGCPLPDFVRHIESQFSPGMTWENRGQHVWHIDHIIPVAAFDLTDPDHQRMCFHYTNMRPLWAGDNMSKKDSITPEAIRLLACPRPGNCADTELVHNVIE